MALKFGKKPAKFNPYALKFRDYASTAYVAPPYAAYTYGITEWGMMLNGPETNAPAGVPSDGLGDCTIATCGHAIQVWTKGTITPPDSLILQKYEQWDGYVLGDENTDNGGEPSSILSSWHNQTFGGHVLKAFVSPQPQNFGHVMHSIAEFGGIYMGLQIPNSAVTQNSNGQIWDVVKDDGGIAGGHAIWCPAYHIKDNEANGANTITCITWGGLQKMTVAFWDKYCDESYTLLGAAWEPKGFNSAQLLADLTTVNG